MVKGNRKKVIEARIKKLKKSGEGWHEQDEQRLDVIKLARSLMLEHTG